MVEFTSIIMQFGEMGEKTGWSYLIIPAHIAQEINPGIKVGYRVKGTLDSYELKQTSLLPMGGGDYILPYNNTMRKAIRKSVGAVIQLRLELDSSEVLISQDLLDCLADEPKALKAFEAMPRSHQRYWSNWIESAKTYETKSKRIVQTIFGLSHGLDYGATLRYFRENKI